MKCDECGITLEKLKNTPFPVLYGFELEDGTEVKYCRFCISKMEQAITEKDDNFFQRMKGARHE